MKVKAKKLTLASIIIGSMGFVLFLYCKLRYHNAKGGKCPLNMISAILMALGVFLLAGAVYDNWRASQDATGFRHIPYLNKRVWVPITEETLESDIVRSHKNNEMWEPHIADLLRKHTKKNSNAVDIGALLGTHSYVLSDAVEEGTVYSFEPQPWAHDSIEKTIRENKVKNISLFNIGLSNEKGELNFCSDRTGGSHIIKGDESCTLPYSYKIQVEKLDDYDLKNISCMKIDVEGHELEVLEGSKNTLNTNRPTIIIEVWNKPNSRKNIRDFMERNSYSMKHISGDDFLCTPLWI